MNTTNSELTKDKNSKENSSKEMTELQKEIPTRKQPSATTNDIPDFGWSNYAERMNGRFAMIGFFAILLVELLSKKSSFLQWAGFIN
tara:strand:- start:215 stop:475 length:261 start_codon:yes stop_codon:yes gene_type:complete